ncbi:MAG: hypothetical protein R2867_07220 [Caldilineaceae bacterium]
MILSDSPSHPRFQAQDDDNPGTIPNGTIPGDRLLYLPIVARQAAVDSPRQPRRQPQNQPSMPSLLPAHRATAQPQNTQI